MLYRVKQRDTGSIALGVLGPADEADLIEEEEEAELDESDLIQQ